MGARIAARNRLVFTNSYERLPTLLAWYDRRELSRRAVIRLLGEEWTCFDNVGRYMKRLLDLLPCRGPVRSMMTPDEQTAFTDLSATAAGIVIALRASELHSDRCGAPSRASCHATSRSRRSC